MTLIVRAFKKFAWVALLLAGAWQAASAQTPYGPHLWDKPLDPAILDQRVNDRLSLAQKSIDQLLAVKGSRTVVNTLALYDDAVEQLDSDLEHLLSLGGNDTRPQTRFWNDTLAPHVHQAIGHLFGEVQQLMGEG